MGRKIFEQCILTLLFAVFGVFVLVAVSFLDFGSMADMNYNEFFSPNAVVVSVVTALIILAISAITSRIVIRKYDICTLIK